MEGSNNVHSPFEIDNLDSIVANSFKDFHVKGFDYICLKRTPEETKKVYFFNGDVSKMPEVVNPHDHRYHFHTMVLTGEVANSIFKIHPTGEWMQQFDYHTPLNGGSGFSWKQEVKVRHLNTRRYASGRGYLSLAEDIHTIRICQEGTVLMLTQYEDELPLDQPTRTFSFDKEPPSLSGLYSKFTHDEVIKYLKLLDIAHK